MPGRCMMSVAFKSCLWAGNMLVFLYGPRCSLATTRLWACLRSACSRHRCMCWLHVQAQEKHLLGHGRPLLQHLLCPLGSPTHARVCARKRARRIVRAWSLPQAADEQRHVACMSWCVQFLDWVIGGLQPAYIPCVNGCKAWPDGVPGQWAVGQTSRMNRTNRVAARMLCASTCHSSNEVAAAHAVNRMFG